MLVNKKLSKIYKKYLIYISKFIKQIN